MVVVDDDEGIRRFAAKALGPGGYDVVTACDGSDAIRLVEAQPRFDLFVIDVMMPSTAFFVHSTSFGTSVGSSSSTVLRPRRR